MNEKDPNFIYPGFIDEVKGALNQGGGVSSWNDLTDKPFYDDSIVIENKKIAEGSVTDSSGVFLKISDKTIPHELLGKIVMYDSHGSALAVSMQDFVVNNEELALSELVGVVYKDGASYGEMVFPSVGVYAFPMQDGFNNVLKFVVEDIKTIDPKYLPEGSGGGGATTFYTSSLDGGSIYVDVECIQKVSVEEAHKAAEQGAVLIMYADEGFECLLTPFAATYSEMGGGEVMFWCRYGNKDVSFTVLNAAVG